ncbi:uncharacterized protein LOC105208875 isoform X3 [Zeugodacus cucurbitae]|nr:uncharacterized protein LOC105208875 isoform X3 [Zeugodacus cucurbitae]XP_054086665.1 uncharacterized protein LOC105208875 isoform X3 [Zeugodacus cucurbitae]
MATRSRQRNESTNKISDSDNMHNTADSRLCDAGKDSTARVSRGGKTAQYYRKYRARKKAEREKEKLEIIADSQSSQSTAVEYPREYRTRKKDSTLAEKDSASRVSRGGKTAQYYRKYRARKKAEWEKEKLEMIADSQSSQSTAEEYLREYRAHKKDSTSAEKDSASRVSRAQYYRKYRARKKAEREYQREYRARKKDSTSAKKDSASCVSRGGKTAQYYRKYRAQKKAEREYLREYRARKKNATSAVPSISAEATITTDESTIVNSPITAGPSTPVDGLMTAGPPITVDPSMIGGPSTCIDPSTIAGPSTCVDPSTFAGPATSSGIHFRNIPRRKSTAEYKQEYRAQKKAQRELKRAAPSRQRNESITEDTEQNTNSTGNENAVSPTPSETEAITDPIEVYNMFIVEDEESKDSVKQNAWFHKRLIRHVRRQRILYDPKHKQFCCAEAKNEVWEKIAKRMGCDADICKNAWVNLRYAYQKYVRRLRKFFANKANMKRRRRPIMAFETELVFLWRFIADKVRCPLPFSEEMEAKEATPVAKPATEDDDIVLLEDDVEVIDLDDDTPNITKVFSKHQKVYFQITPEMRRLIYNLQCYQEIYDSLHRYHDDYRRKGIIWNAVANEVGDKATKLMKCWIQIQTRYEWELMQRRLQEELLATKPQTELESMLHFMKPHILKMPRTVYKSSYFLKKDWHEPIDHFKNIFSLLVAMKKHPTVIAYTEIMVNKTEEVDTAKYTQLWNDVAKAKGGAVTPGQCETTWLILRLFYWELMSMRKHSYQLQDKWYFETIITELYALSKVQKFARAKKSNLGALMLSSICADDLKKPSTDNANKSKQTEVKTIHNNTTPPPNAPLTPNTIVPISVNLDEDKISSSIIETKSQAPKNAIKHKKPLDIAIASSSATSSTTVSNNGLVVTVTKVPAKMHATPVIQQDAQTTYPQARSPQIRVKSQAQLQAEPVKMLVQTRPQIQIHAQPATPAPNQPIQIRLQTPAALQNPIQTITLPRVQQTQQQQFQMLPLTPIQAQSKLPTKQNQSNLQASTQFLTTNMAQLLPPTTNEIALNESTTITLDTIKTPKIVSAVSLAPRAAFAAPFINKGLQITAVAGASPPAPQHTTPPQLPTTVVVTPTSGTFNLPFSLPDNTNISKCPPLSCVDTNTLTDTIITLPNPVLPVSTLQQANVSLPIMEVQSLESKIPATVLARPHLTPTSQLNANEIMIELISSVNGNQLVVHGPPLEQKYSLPMSTTALLIREVLSIPYLHKKDYNKPQQVNSCWQYLAKRFNLPVHICKACWNFLSENFAHFPQIAPMEELTKPVKIGMNVWRENYAFFQTFNEKAAQLRLPFAKDAVEMFFDNIRDQTKHIPRVAGKKLTFVADWQAAINSNPHVPNKVWFGTWTLFKSAFMKYMRDLEIGIDNKWSLEWWRVLAKMDFLIEEQYHNMEPFYYIVRNKMIDECERCIKEEQKFNIDVKTKRFLPKKETAHPMLQKIPDIDAYRVIMTVRRYPQIYQKATEGEKAKAWEKVAFEMRTTVTACRFAFQCALKNYRLYATRDPANRCRLNHRYYKHLAEIYRAIKPTRKINIKTPSELNQSVSENPDANESVFPERFIMDINMSNSHSNVVMKNWAYGVGASVPAEKLTALFEKYRPASATSETFTTNVSTERSSEDLSDIEDTKEKRRRYMRSYRAKQSKEAREARLQQVRQRAAEIRASESKEAREARLQQVRQHAAEIRASESKEAREARLQQVRQYAAEIRASESKKARETRLQQVRQRAAAIRSSESKEARETRLQQMRQYATESRGSGSKEAREARLQQVQQQNADITIKKE